MPKYLVTITEIITNSRTFVREGDNPEELRDRIEEGNDYDPDELDPQTVEVSAWVHGDAKRGAEESAGETQKVNTSGGEAFPGDVEPCVLELLKEMDDVISRRFVDSSGPAGCRVVPLGDGPSYSGPVGGRSVNNEDKTPEEIKKAVPFAALTRKEKADVLNTFICWDRFRELGLPQHVQDIISANVMAGKPREQWLEGISPI